MFRQIKEMKAMLEGSPEMVEQAQALGAQAQRLAVAQAAVRQAEAVRQADGTRTGYAEGGYAQAGGSDEPIAGVSLEQYAAISKYAAAFGHDPAKMAEFAEARGISELAWRAAVAGGAGVPRHDAAAGGPAGCSAAGARPHRGSHDRPGELGRHLAGPGQSVMTGRRLTGTGASRIGIWLIGSLAGTSLGLAATSGLIGALR